MRWPAVDRGGRPWAGAAGSHRRPREVNYVNTAAAELRHGVPVIDFTKEVRHSWDFSRFPFSSYVKRIGSGPLCGELVEAQGDTLHSGRFAREFEILNRLSEQMTRFAYCAVDRNGCAFRRSWHRVRPDGWARLRPKQPEHRFPVPYLAFPKRMADQLFWLATGSMTTGYVFTCPTCHRNVDSGLFRSPRCRTEFFEDGNFVAHCYHCGDRRKWHLDDVVAAKVKRRFGRPFQEQFCAAVSRELPLASVGATVYGGPVALRGAEGLAQSDVHCPRALKLLPHQLRLPDGGRRIVFLPPTARIRARIGQELAPGETWCFVLPPPSRWWGRANLREQWGRLAELFGGAQYIGLLQQAWFEQELVVLPEHPEIVLCRSDLGAAACRDLKPLVFWWDIRPLARHLDGVVEAAVLPVIPLRRWDQLRLTVADVMIDAALEPVPRASPPRRVRSTARAGETDP